MSSASTGDVPASDEALRRDERASEVYEQLSEGSPAAAAGVIADEVASIVKQAEDGHTTLSAQLPAVPLDELAAAEMSAPAHAVSPGPDEASAAARQLPVHAPVD